MIAQAQATTTTHTRPRGQLLRLDRPWAGQDDRTAARNPIRRYIAEQFNPEADINRDRSTATTGGRASIDGVPGVATDGCIDRNTATARRTTGSNRFDGNIFRRIEANGATDAIETTHIDRKAIGVTGVRL